MTETKEAAATATCLWGIGAELDDIHVQFHRVRNMLSVYEERIEADIEFLGESKDGYAKWFTSRYDVLRSVMEVMEINLCAAIDAMQVQIDAVYEADKKARPRPLPAE